MARLTIGDQVRVLRNTARKGAIGTIVDIILCVNGDDRFLTYVVQFDTPKGHVSEHYLWHELYIPLRKQCAMTTK
jgi:hypothetical protein